jgi:hypothetical protein
MLIKQTATLDCQKLPQDIKTKLFSVYSDCRSNDSYFYLDLDEYRNWTTEYGTYAEYFSQNQADVLHWLCAQTTEPEVLVLYWW